MQKKIDLGWSTRFIANCIDSLQIVWIRESIGAWVKKKGKQAKQSIYLSNLISQSSLINSLIFLKICKNIFCQSPKIRSPHTTQKQNSLAQSWSFFIFAARLLFLFLILTILIFCVHFGWLPFSILQNLGLVCKNWIRPKNRIQFGSVCDTIFRFSGYWLNLDFFGLVFTWEVELWMGAELMFTWGEWILVICIFSCTLKWVSKKGIQG